MFNNTNHHLSSKQIVMAGIAHVHSFMLLFIFWFSHWFRIRGCCSWVLKWRRCTRSCRLLKWTLNS